MAMSSSVFILFIFKLSLLKCQGGENSHPKKIGKLSKRIPDLTEATKTLPVKHVRPQIK